MDSGAMWRGEVRLVVETVVRWVVETGEASLRRVAGLGTHMHV